MNAMVKHDKPAPLTSGGKISAIVPQSMEDAYRLGKAVCMAGMAPRGLDTPEKAMIAIMQGMEVGLTPMASLQRIAVVNGRPTIWGDGAMSLVRASGLCEYVRETIDGKDDGRVAICAVKRRGEPDEVARRFSVADAKKAGLWGKQGPWQQYPERMLQMRARAFALRDVFADVLGGMYLREEIDDGREMRDVTPPAPPSPPSPPSPDAEPATEAEIVDEGEGFDLGEFLETLETNLAGQDTPEDVEEVWSDSDVEATLESEGHGDMIEAARSIKDRRLQALERDDFPSDPTREMHPLEAG